MSELDDDITRMPLRSAGVRRDAPSTDGAGDRDRDRDRDHGFGIDRDALRRPLRDQGGEVHSMEAVFEDEVGEEPPVAPTVAVEPAPTNDPAPTNAETPTDETPTPTDTTPEPPASDPTPAPDPSEPTTPASGEMTYTPGGWYEFENWTPKIDAPGAPSKGLLDEVIFEDEFMAPTDSDGAPIDEGDDFGFGGLA